MSDTTQSCTYLAVSTGFIGTAAGYFIRFWLAQRTARRKEDWDQLRDFTSHINELGDEAVAFFCTQETDAVERQKKAIRIQRLISVSGQKATSFSRALGDSSVFTYQKRLRQSITMDGFDADIKRPCLRPSDDVIINIENACSALIGALDRSYTRLHRGNISKGASNG